MQRHTETLVPKAKGHSIFTGKGGTYTVVSTSGRQYTVYNLHGLTLCSCPWGVHHPGEPCSHVLAVLRYRYHNARLSFHNSLEQARKQHRPWQKIGDNLYITIRR